MGKKLLTTLALTGAMLVLPATAAFAHECIVANRSAQGAIGAGGSGQWFSISLEDVFAFEFSVPEANVDDAVAEAIDAGIPEVVAIFGKFTLAGGTGAASNGALADGKGLEHLSQSPLAATIGEIALKWGGTIPDFE
ncbi:MAG: hypothetical protein WEB06_15775 [Actinomycetota bacterium]